MDPLQHHPNKEDPGFRPSHPDPEDWGPWPRRPWRAHRWRSGPWGWRSEKEASPEWQKRRSLGLRFLWIFGSMVLVFLLGMGGLAFGLSRLFGGTGQIPWFIWLLGLGLVIGLPLTALTLGIRSFTRFANPMARIMAAADTVAEGNFSVRVSEDAPGEVARLAQSFNRMVAELERTDQLRRSLTADVAHELRTPIHIIQGNLEGILDGVYEPTPQQIELLLDETRQLSRLVEDLRTLSLAEAGQLSLKIEEVEVDELLSDVVTSFSGQAEAAGLDLRVEPVPETLVVRADPGRLDQVLSNLVANALRHTPAGGQIKLSASRVEDGVCIRVADTGSGIPSEDLPNIFDRFWRADHSSKGNTGLGLAIARQLVQAHGGTIGVESQVGQGSKFTITLPLR
ncbi:MAG TPA: HAMP domain-containing sensor histidine kinase [Anaerolineaceae bacterium]|nr:HAMP domain-containing sensor histidine kinase [Anaerolineaceae bacterium]